jgi:hypothetical protein
MLYMIVTKVYLTGLVHVSHHIQGHKGLVHVSHHCHHIQGHKLTFSCWYY